MKYINHGLYLVPENEECENLEEFFLYIYDTFFKTSKAFAEIDVLDFLKNSKTQITKVEELDSNKKWFLYHLLVFKHQSDFFNLKYLSNVILKVIYNIKEINNSLIITYLNYINEGLHHKTGKALRVRPKEISRVISSKSIEYPVVLEILKSFDMISNVFRLNIGKVHKIEKKNCNYNYSFIAEDYMGFVINYINRFVVFPTDNEKEKRRKNVELYINTSLYLDANVSPYFNIKMVDDLVDIVVNSSLRAFKE